MAQGLRHFLLAVQFFTRVPVTGRLAVWVGYSPEMLRLSAAYFPLVGVLVGLWGGAVLLAALWCLGSDAVWVAAALSTAATVWATGGFHEDGLADTADALGGHVSLERSLEIMKDSRIGAYGALAVVLALLIKVAAVALLASRAPTVAAAVLVWAHSGSRAAALAPIRFLPHVGDAAGAKSKPLADSLSGSRLAIACFLGLIGFLPFWSVKPAQAAAFLIANLMLLSLLSWRSVAWLRTRLGGYTGDTLGATQQMAELAVLLTACAVVTAA